jgi:TetR/AcrR family transcriptional regulator
MPLSKIARSGLKAPPLDAIARAEPIEPAEIVEPRGSGRRRSTRGESQRAKILQAAFECFHSVGFDAATTRQIAQQTKCSHTAVLYHFNSKEELWIATMEMAIAEYINTIRNNFEGRDNLTAKEALQTFIREFVRFSAKSPGVHRMLSMESTQGTSRLDWIIDHYLRDHFTIIRDLIRRGQVEHSVREGDPARLYYFILSAGSAPFTLSSEYQALTGRDVFSETEIYQTIGFIYDMVFLPELKRPVKG